MTAAPHSSAAELPVRPGEAPWTDAELAELRIELEKEAAALRAELGEVAGPYLRAHQRHGGRGRGRRGRR